MMMNPYDSRAIKSMIAFRTEQIMRDAEGTKVIEPARRASDWGVERMRRAIGVRMIRAGARISGEHVQDLPGVQPGV